MEELEPRRRYRCRWRGRVGPSVAFEFLVEEVEEPARMRGRARGDLEGTGEWRLTEAAGVTTVTYDWRVRPVPAWMRLRMLAPLLRRNHHAVMARGGAALAQRLGAGPRPR